MFNTSDPSPTSLRSSCFDVPAERVLGSYDHFPCVINKRGANLSNRPAMLLIAWLRLDIEQKVSGYDANANERTLVPVFLPNFEQLNLLVERNVFFGFSLHSLRCNLVDGTPQDFANGIDRSVAILQTFD